MKYDGAYDDLYEWHKEVFTTSLFFEKRFFMLLLLFSNVSFSMVMLRYYEIDVSN